MPRKSARKSAPGRPFVSHDPRAGHGPAKGAPNAGRPPEEYLTWLGHAVHSDKCRAQVQRVLEDADHPAFAKILIASLDRLHGKAVQPLSVGTDDDSVDIALEIRQAR